MKYYCTYLWEKELGYIEYQNNFMQSYGTSKPIYYDSLKIARRVTKNFKSYFTNTFNHKIIPQ